MYHLEYNIQQLLLKHHLVFRLNFFADSNLVVQKTAISNGAITTLTLAASPANAAQYSASGAGVTGGGSITLGGGATVNDKYTISRNLPIARTTDFATTGIFPIDSLNTELDKIIAMMQQQGVDINLSPRASSTTSTAYGLIFPELVADKYYQLIVLVML